MVPVSRLPASERRQEILAAATRLFAERGFHGVTTRDLAAAAEVSEGLLFKHFPSKDAIFAAILTGCQAGNQGDAKRLDQLVPGTQTLVILVHTLVASLVDGPCGRDGVTVRLVLRSLLEDGEFARKLLGKAGEGPIRAVADSIRAARRSGDLAKVGVDPWLGAWMVQHLAVMAMLSHLPEPPALDYRLPRGRLIGEIVRFALRGLGMAEAVIDRHYRPEALALLPG